MSFGHSLGGVSGRLFEDDEVYHRMHFRGD